MTMTEEKKNNLANYVMTSFFSALVGAALASGYFYLNQRSGSDLEITIENPIVQIKDQGKVIKGKAPLSESRNILDLFTGHRADKWIKFEDEGYIIYWDYNNDGKYDRYKSVYKQGSIEEKFKEIQTDSTGR